MSANVALICIFSPKLWIIFFEKDKNVRKQEGESILNKRYLHFPFFPRLWYPNGDSMTSILTSDHFRSSTNNQSSGTRHPEVSGAASMHVTIVFFFLLFIFIPYLHGLWLPARIKKRTKCYPYFPRFLPGCNAFFYNFLIERNFPYFCYEPDWNSKVTVSGPLETAARDCAAVQRPMTSRTSTPRYWRINADAPPGNSPIRQVHQALLRILSCNFYVIYSQDQRLLWYHVLTEFWGCILEALLLFHGQGTLSYLKCHRWQWIV